MDSHPVLEEDTCGCRMLSSASIWPFGPLIQPHLGVQITSQVFQGSVHGNVRLTDRTRFQLTSPQSRWAFLPPGGDWLKPISWQSLYILGGRLHELEIPSKVDYSSDSQTWDIKGAFKIHGCLLIEDIKEVLFCRVWQQCWRHIMIDLRIFRHK